MVGCRPSSADRAEVGRPVAGVCKLASLKRKTAATDALWKSEFHAPECSDPLVDSRRPRAREARPMAAGRRALRRQLHLFIVPAVYMLFAADHRPEEAREWHPAQLEPATVTRLRRPAAAPGTLTLGLGGCSALATRSFCND